MGNRRAALLDSVARLGASHAERVTHSRMDCLGVDRQDGALQSCRPAAHPVPGVAGNHLPGRTAARIRFLFPARTLLDRRHRSPPNVRGCRERRIRLGMANVACDAILLASCRFADGFWITLGGRRCIAWPWSSLDGGFRGLDSGGVTAEPSRCARECCRLWSLRAGFGRAGCLGAARATAGTNQSRCRRVRYHDRRILLFGIHG